MRRLLLLSMFLGACHLYTGGDDDSPPPDAACEYGVGGGGVADIVVHDPYTGQCVSDYTPPPCEPGCPCYPTEGATVDAGVTTGGGGSLDAGAAGGGGADIPVQEESGECYGPCSTLDESDCLANAECHATYEQYEDPTGLTTGTSQFWSCWDITPDTPEYTGLPCNELDDWTCSVSPGCASLFDYDEYGDTYFASCIDKGSGSGSDVNPGECSGTVTCDMAPPACPAGTYAGILDGCYTGYCIPAAACGPLPCTTLTTESQCTARPDCDAVYVGSDCTCDDSGCTCASEMFEKCVADGDSSGGGSGGGSAMPL